MPKGDGGDLAGRCWGARVALGAVSATPLPGWFWIVAGAIIAAWIGIEGGEGDRARRWRQGLRGGVLAVLGLGVAMEVPFHGMPTLPRLGSPPLEVVGDSLSAGMGEPAEGTWPAVLERRHEVAVHNRALAGATAASAATQAEQVTEPGALVLVAIGGNDVLGGTPPETFARALDALLGRLHADGRTVVMLEFPSPRQRLRRGPASPGPTAWRVARAQAARDRRTDQPGRHDRHDPPVAKRACPHGRGDLARHPAGVLRDGSRDSSLSRPASRHTLIRGPHIGVGRTRSGENTDVAEMGNSRRCRGLGRPGDRGAAVPVSRAGDDEDKPLKKLMKKIDADTKSIREATTSVTKFKKAGNGKDLARMAGEIAKLGKETREFKEPSEKMKKPFDKWLDMNDRFVAAADELAKSPAKETSSRPARPGRR